jgi:NAD(P)H-hydrate epimerase
MRVAGGELRGTEVRVTSDPTITREVSALPRRSDDAHKGDVGRVAIIGGCAEAIMMLGAPAMAANAAFRSGAGLVQLIVPEAIRAEVTVLAPCATTRCLPGASDELVRAVNDSGADVVALGPGLGTSLSPAVVAEFINGYTGRMVIDADGLNALAAASPFAISEPQRVVLTPHPGEARRLLEARGQAREIERTTGSRRAAAAALVDAYGCVVVLKGRGTIVNNGRRMYINETGNSGMATGGAGDVLTGIITALIGQRMDPFEAAILGVYLHGLAGDFAAEELGRWSLTTMDIIEYLPEAFCEHEASGSE